MRGLMMDFPLTVPALLERAGHIFGKVEIVTRRPDRSLARTTWRDLYGRARRLANALTGLGLQRGDRVASLLWNQSEHMEAYFGVPIAGGVLHTLNLRLHPDEIAFIASHAGDRFLIVDDVLLPVYEKFRDRVKFERVIVVPFGGCATPPNGTTITRSNFTRSRNFSYTGSSTSSTIRKRSPAWLAMKAISSGCNRKFSVWSTPPAIGTPKYASMCSDWFHNSVATRSPRCKPRLVSAFARRRARP